MSLSEPEVDGIRQIFDQFDRDKDSTINIEELAKLAIALNNPLPPAELLDFFRNIDTDKSGKITWSEFIKYWMEQDSGWNFPSLVLHTHNSVPTYFK